MPTAAAPTTPATPTADTAATGPTARTAPSGRAASAGFDRLCSSRPAGQPPALMVADVLYVDRRRSIAELAAGARRNRNAHLWWMRRGTREQAIATIDGFTQATPLDDAVTRAWRAQPGVAKYAQTPHGAPPAYVSLPRHTCRAEYRQTLVADINGVEHRLFDVALVVEVEFDIVRLQVVNRQVSAFPGSAKVRVSVRTARAGAQGYELLSREVADISFGHIVTTFTDVLLPPGLPPPRSAR